MFSLRCSAYTKKYSIDETNTAILLIAVAFFFFVVCIWLRAVAINPINFV